MILKTSSVIFALIGFGLYSPVASHCQTAADPVTPPLSSVAKPAPAQEEIERVKKCGLRFRGMEAAVLNFELSEAKKDLDGYWVKRAVFVLTPAIMGCIAFAEANRISTTVSDDFLTKLYDGQLRTIVLIYAAPEQFAPENPAFRLQFAKKTVLPSSYRELDTVSIGWWRAGYKTPKLIAEIVGHSDITTTLRIYTHPNATEAQEALSDISKNLLFSPD
jgi:hypothetical protein